MLVIIIAMTSSNALVGCPKESLQVATGCHMLQPISSVLELFNAFWGNRFGEFSQIWITCDEGQSDLVGFTFIKVEFPVLR